MSKARKLDTEAVRQAAAGRWLEVLTSVAGLSEEILDGQHHPCPKCGGDDRFRLIDKDAGAVLCNQCFSTKNGDGFAAVAWSRGVKFPEAVKQVAEWLGVAATKGGDSDPAKDLRWMPWSNNLARHFCAAKKPITEASLLAAGARMARYKDKFTVIALPIIGATLDVSKPVGWAIYNYNAAPLPKWNKDGEVVGQVKVKITYGSKPGLVGVHAIERIGVAGLPELVWKVEGITDLLAMLSIMPEEHRDRHLVLTNANGAGETPRWPATVLAPINSLVVHDADVPGQTGAENWTKQIAAQNPAGVTTKNVLLPYEVEEKHGKDLRDFFSEGNGYGALLTLADATSAIEVKRTATGEVDPESISYPYQERILKKLQLEVLLEDEEGRVRVFSTFLRKSSWIRKIEWLKSESMIQICGSPAIEHISIDPDGEETFSMSDVRKALALAASKRRGKHDDRGVGVWQGLDEKGNETETIVLVNDTEAARFNGDRMLRRVIIPRIDGLVLDFGSGHDDWFNFDELAGLIESAKAIEWREAVIEEACSLFSKWRWQTDSIDEELGPLLMTGLVMSSWIQTLWNWRPLVAIIGESNSGKSMMLEALGGSISTRGIFGNLAFKSAKSTEPGVRQGIGNSGVICFLDEFEKCRDRERILEMFRASTRGETVAKGTAGSQKGIKFTLRHIAWIAATESGLDKQPDSNRFIQFDLLTAKRGQHNKLRLPEGAYLQQLGQKLLAIAVLNAIKSKRLAMVLKSTSVEGIDPRTVESYAAPAAVLSTAMDYSDDAAAALLSDLLKAVDRSDQGRTDHEDLLSDILSSQVNCGGKDGMLTVAQILEGGSRYYEHSGRMEASGVSLVESGRLFIAHAQVSRVLLKDSAWKGQRIDQILSRIPGATKGRHRFSGQNPRGVFVPIEPVEAPTQQHQAF